MSNDYSELIARLHKQKEDAVRVGWGMSARLSLEAADALTAQAREIEALRADAERWRYAVAPGLDQSMNWLDVYEEWAGEGDFTTAIDAALASGKAVTPDAYNCRKCGGRMVEGTYLAQTFSGAPDFPGDKHAVTVSPSGPGRLEPCSKCEACGHSVTDGKAVTP